MRILTAIFLFILCVSASLAAVDLSLDRCVELALKNNEAVAVAENMLAGTRAKVQEKRAALFPLLGLSATYTRLPYASASKATVLGGSLDDYNLSVTLTQPLYAGGKLWSEGESAELEQKKAVDGLARVRTDLALDVAIAYYAVRHAEEVLAAKRESHRHLADYFKRSSELARRTLLPRQEDLLQVEVQLVNASIEVEAAETSRRKAVRGLLDLVRVEEDAAVFSNDLPVPTRVDLPAALALENNYQYRMALYDLAIARQAVTVSRSALLPELNLNAYTNWEGPRLLPTNDYSQWGISLELLLFDFMKTPARVRQSELVVEQGQANLDLLARQLRLAYQDLLDDLSSAWRRFQLAEENLARAERGLKLFQARAQSYTVNSKQLLDAEQAALQARLNQLNVLLDHQLSQLELARLLGREKI
ncbi:MAG: TolC family protein [Candidatus Margulisiibacteriota bacterium]